MREIKRPEVKGQKQNSRIKSSGRSFFTFAFCLFTLTFSAAAHDGKPHNFADLLRSWSFDPLIVFSLVVAAGVYCQGIFNLWRSAPKRRGLKSGTILFFAGGWLALVLALVSPLHPWGEVLFSAHMTQHEILMLVAAPLLVLSHPLVAFMWALPRKWRTNAKEFLKSKFFEKNWRFWLNPFVAWFIHAIALWIWHLPYLFQATLQSDLVHTLQHLSFFLSALLFWQAIIASPRGLTSYGAGVLYLFTTSIHSGILGAFLTFTTRILYPAYEKSTASWGLTPLEDQQLGGLIMWVPAGLVYIVAGLTMFAGWLKDSEKRVLRREQNLFGSSKISEV